MKNRREVVTYFGFGLFIAFFLISILVVIELSMLEQSIKDAVAGYGYGGIVIVSFLADMIMQPIGPDIPMVAGLVVGLNPLGVYLAALTGSAGATILSFFLGSVYGEAGFQKFYGYTKYEKWRRMYEKYGKLIVLAGALTPVPFVPMCWLSGMFRMNKIEFLAYGIGGRSLRLLGVVFLTTQIINLA
jgi:membrane protein YqaA with SNARE-associated domain